MENKRREKIYLDREVGRERDCQIYIFSLSPSLSLQFEKSERVSLSFPQIRFNRRSFLTVPRKSVVFFFQQSLSASLTHAPRFLRYGQQQHTHTHTSHTYKLHTYINIYWWLHEILSSLTRLLVLGFSVDIYSCLLICSKFLYFFN